MFSKTENFELALEHAIDCAVAFGEKNVETIHLLLGVLFVKDCTATFVMEEHGITYDWVSSVLAAAKEPPPLDQIDLEADVPPSLMAAQVIQKTRDFAAVLNNDVMDVDHLALALFNKNGGTHSAVIEYRTKKSMLYDEVFDAVLAEIPLRVANQVTIED